MTQRYSGTIYARSESELRSVAFRCDVARFLVDLDKSPSATLDWMSEQFYEVHDGALIDQKGRLIDPGAISPKQLWPRALSLSSAHLDALRRDIGVCKKHWRAYEMDFNDLFGKDSCSTVKSIKKLADRPPNALAQRHTAARWMFLAFAMDIHLAAKAQAHEESTARAT